MLDFDLQLNLRMLCINMTYFYIIKAQLNLLLYFLVLLWVPNNILDFLRLRDSLFVWNHLFNLLSPLLMILFGKLIALLDVKALVLSAYRIKDNSGTEFGMSLT